MVLAHAVSEFFLRPFIRFTCGQSRFLITPHDPNRVNEAVLNSAVKGPALLFFWEAHQVRVAVKVVVIEELTLSEPPLTGLLRSFCLIDRTRRNDLASL